MFPAWVLMCVHISVLVHANTYLCMSGVFICSVHVSVHLSQEERSQEVWWATQVGFSEVIIFAWLITDCHALAPNAASNSDITPQTPPHTYTHSHACFPSLIIPSLWSQRTDCGTHTHTYTHLLSTTAQLQQKGKEEEWGNWRVFKWPGA